MPSGGPALGMLSSRGAPGSCSPRTGREPLGPGLARESTHPPCCCCRCRCREASRRPNIGCLGAQPAQPPPTLLPLPFHREAKLGRLSVGTADRSANPGRGPANESWSPETSRRWLFLITLCLKWGRGGVSPPPLKANTMRRAVGFPVLCLLLNLHAAGKGMPGRAGAGEDKGRGTAHV